MESNIVASKPKASSLASNQSREKIVDNWFSCDNILTNASISKEYSLELSKSAQAAKNNFNLTMRQWQEVKSRSQIENYDRSDNALSRSSCSYSSVKNDVLLLENSTSNLRGIYDNDDDAGNIVTTDGSTLQVVLTPRTPKAEEKKEEKAKQTPLNQVPAPIRAKNSLSSVKTTSKKPTRKASKSKKKSQLNKMNDEQFKTSLIYSAKGRRKKAHGRLKNSNSKSTIATRDTSFSDKKIDRKKFKRQMSLDTISTCQSSQARKRAAITLKAKQSKQLDSKSDFIEIFHGKTMKSGGNDDVSSRLSKSVAKTVAEAKKRKIVQQSIVEKNHNDDVNPQIHLQDPFATHDQNNSRQEQYRCVHEQPTKDYSPEVYDPFHPRNYELPTMASKMKRVHKPYYHHFNIKNIPFVVGTSLSPSHNLGLNIQQVLSIIKVKQPAVPGISPLLIRKVSRGVRPVSTLFEHINNQYSRTYRDLGLPQRNSYSQQRIGSFSCEQLISASSSLVDNRTSSSFRQNVIREPLYEEDEDNRSMCSDTRTRYSQQQAEKCRSRKQRQHHHCYQHPIESGSNHDARASNSKEITKVFTRLHDQFDKMLSQYERLQEQLEKRKDKSLLKEVSELEVAITNKEQEITAVVNLYEEVNQLKKQMKRLHERNSFVCITTPDPSFQSTPGKIRARTAPGPFLDAKPSRREMPNALKLVGLLRQMQAFQRQLALA